MRQTSEDSQRSRGQKAQKEQIFFGIIKSSIWNASWKRENLNAKTQLFMVNKDDGWISIVEKNSLNGL